MKALHTLSALSIAVLLSACGGGREPEASPQQVRDLVAAMHARSDDTGPNRRTMALKTVGAKEVLDWAEYRYSETFPKGPSSISLDYQGVTYTVRAYPNGNYLGVTEDGGIYGLGPFTNNDLRGFGRIADYEAQIKADSCYVYPSDCPTNPPNNSRNGCTMAAADALKLGNRLQLEYLVTTTGVAPSSGQYTLDSLVAQYTPFAGSSAVQTTYTLSGTSTGGGVTTVSNIKGKDYVQEAANGLILDLGDEVESDIRTPQGNLQSVVRTVYAPAYLNSEFTLLEGQSLTRTIGSRVTSSSIINGVPTQASETSQSYTETLTYELRENISVQGRTYDTCRYRETRANSTDVTTTWYLYGKGIPVRTRVVGTGSDEITELKSGSFNGSPL